jgi:hypothetical protein
MKLPVDTSAPLGLGLAILFGFVFGFLLDRGRVDRYDVIVNFFRLRDFRVLKIMLSAIVIGGIGVALLVAADLATFHIKPLHLLAIIVGGAIFGIGMVLLGYCPGTGIAAIGTGSIHAAIGLLGMIAGSILYGVTYPWISEHILSIGDLGKATLPSLTGIPAFAWWIIIVIVVGVVFALVSKLKSKTAAKVAGAN